MNNQTCFYLFHLNRIFFLVFVIFFRNYFFHLFLFCRDRSILALLLPKCAPSHKIRKHTENFFFITVSTLCNKIEVLLFTLYLSKCFRNEWWLEWKRKVGNGDKANYSHPFQWFSTAIGWQWKLTPQNQNLYSLPQTQTPFWDSPSVPICKVLSLHYPIHWLLINTVDPWQLGAPTFQAVENSCITYICSSSIYAVPHCKIQPTTDHIVLSYLLLEKNPSVGKKSHV